MTGESDLRRTYYLLAILALVGAFMYWARPVMMPVTIAVLTSFVLAPLVGRMERWGVPRFVASTAALAGAAVLLIGIAQVFVQQVGSLAHEIPTYKTQIAQKVGDLRQAAANSWIGDALDFANELGKKPAPEKTSPEQPEETIATKIEIPVIVVAQYVAGTAADILLNAILVLILALMMLMRREDLRNRMIQLMGTDNRVTATRALDDASKRISRFLFFQLLINIGFGLVVAIGLFFIGMPFAYVWGGLAALLRYVPFFGGCIAAAFPLLASLVLPTWTPFFLIATFFIVIELLQANLVEPLVFGHSIGVSGAGQVVAMLFWASLWGPGGLILATPLTACLCVLGHHFPGLRFFATLMGDGEIFDKPDAFYQRLLAGDTVEAAILAEGYLKETCPTKVIDELLIPSLLSARSDHRSGDLTDEDQLLIIETVRDVFNDLALVGQPEHQETANPTASLRPHVLVVEFPFNDETDRLVTEMLRNSMPGDKVDWSTDSIGNGELEGLAERQDVPPNLVLISTSAKKNLARIRGACKTVHKLFPDAEMLVCCWCLESESDARCPRLKDAGATVVCTTFLQAHQIIDTAANIERQPQMNSTTH